MTGALSHIHPAIDAASFTSGVGPRYHRAMLDRIREKLPTIPEDLGEYARIHTGPGSWSADTNFEPCPDELGRPEHATPRAPYVRLSAAELTDG